MENLLDVAKYISDNISHHSDKKIQKITYYAYCWYIAIKNNNKDEIKNRLFEQHPEAWIHGPVFYDLYIEMTHYRNRFFDRNANLNPNTKKFLDKIISIYDRYTGNQLEDMTHNERPWNEARHGIDSDIRSREDIEDEVIYSYFTT